MDLSYLSLDIELFRFNIGQNPSPNLAKLEVVVKKTVILGMAICLLTFGTAALASVRNEQPAADIVEDPRFVDQAPLVVAADAVFREVEAQSITGLVGTRFDHANGSLVVYWHGDI